MQSYKCEVLSISTFFFLNIFHVFRSFIKCYVIFLLTVLFQGKEKSPDLNATELIKTQEGEFV